MELFGNVERYAYVFADPFYLVPPGQLNWAKGWNWTNARSLSAFLCQVDEHFFFDESITRKEALIVSEPL